MRRRGLRLEVDEPTERQRKNQRWLARNPLVTALVGAAVFGALGAGFAALKDFSLLLGVVPGLLVGAALGWAFSVTYRDPAPRGATRALYFGAVTLGGVALLVVKAL